MELQKLINELQVPPGPNYFYDLQNALNKDPYFLRMNWEGKLMIVNPIRRLSDYSNRAVQEANGAILEAGTTKLVAFSSNVIQDYNETMNQEFENNWQNYRVEELIDGAVVRLYYYDNSWRLATIKSILAKNAYWADKKSFYDLFYEAENNTVDVSKLNPRHCYTFILGSPSNHMIVNYKSPCLYHLATYDLDNFKFVEDSDLGVPRVKQFTFTTFAELQETLNQTNDLPLNENSTLGFILTNTVTGNKIKVENKHYRRARELKGNHPNINFRVLELLKANNFNINSPEINEFLSYFPQYENNINDTLKRFENTVKIFYNQWKKHPDTRYMNTDRLTKHTLEEFHWLSQDVNYFTLDHARQYFQSLNISRLAKLLHIPYFVARRNYPRSRQTSSD